MATLQEIGTSDMDDDTTINTKIAKRNIDELFAGYSPTSSGHNKSNNQFIAPSSNIKSNNLMSSTKGPSSTQSGHCFGMTKMRGLEHSVVSNKTMVQSKFDSLMKDDGIDVSIIERQNQSMQFINTPFQSRQPQKNTKSSNNNTQFNVFCDME